MFSRDLMLGGESSLAPVPSRWPGALSELSGNPPEAYKITPQKASFENASVRLLPTPTELLKGFWQFLIGCCPQTSLP